MSIVWTDTVTPLNAANMNALEQIARKGAANGYASLDGTSKVPNAQLPASALGVPVPAVTNGQWLKGVGGAAVWSAIAAADLPAGAVPSYGTSLPGSPVDGQQHIYVDSLTAPTYCWLLRYNAGSSSAYKWEFIGGTPVAVEHVPAVNLATTGWQYVGITMDLIVPRSGDYDAMTAGMLSTPTANAQCFIGVANASVAAVAIGSQGGVNVASYDEGICFPTLPGLIAAQTLRPIYQTPIANCTVQAKRLTLLPRRIS